MPETETRGAQTRSPALLLLALTVAATPYVLFTAIGRFTWFDDEGTLMVWFRSFLDGHRMYDEVFSLYGPLFSAVYGFVYGVLRVPLTHTSGRLIAALLWLAYTAAFAGFFGGITRSRAAMAAIYALILVWLPSLMNSPGHPEELGLLLMASALLLAASLAARRSVIKLAALGAVLAGLALLKINFGIYVGGGVVLVLLGATAPGVLTRLAIPAVALALLAVPIAVETLLIQFGWVRLYCVFAVLTIGAAVLVVMDQPRTFVLRAADWNVVAGAGVVTAASIVGSMLAAGSSPGAMLNAVLLQNARFVQNWFIPLDIGLPGLAVAVLSAVAAVAYRATVRRQGWGPWCTIGLLVLKAGFVVVGVLLLAFPSQVFRALLPFCWLFAVRPPGTGAREAAARALVGVVGATMCLYPFPVAGGQVVIAGLAPVAMLPVLACDVLAGLRRLGWQDWQRWTTRVLATAAAVAMLAATAGAWRDYAHRVPLGLPGTALIRVPQAQAEDLQWVTDQLAACPASTSLPGQWSFAFWTGQRLLTPINVNGILNFVDQARQQAVVAALSREPGLCVLLHFGLLHFFDRGQAATDPPLLHYIQTAFVKVAERNGYVILKRPGS